MWVLNFPNVFDRKGPFWCAQFSEAVPLCSSNFVCTMVLTFKVLMHFSLLTFM